MPGPIHCLGQAPLSNRQILQVSKVSLSPLLGIKYDTFVKVWTIVMPGKKRSTVIIPELTQSKIITNFGKLKLQEDE